MNEAGAARQAVLRRAIGLVASDAAGAEALARDVLSAAPDSPDALAVLSAALRGQGRAGDALAVIEPAAQAHPGSWLVQFELAQALLALGRSREAVAPLSLALTLNPGLTPGWRMLGDIRMVGGDFSAAQPAYDQVLRSNLTDSRLQGPAQALAEGRLEIAERDLRALLSKDPGAMAAAHLLGEVLGRRGRLVEAQHLLARCVEQAPGAFLARQSLAVALFRGGRCGEALVELDGLLARVPGDNRCRMTKAAALTEIGDYAAAAVVTAGLLETFPDQPQAWLVHGNGLRTLGRIDEAIAAYSRCIALDPNCTDAYWSLANLKTYRFAPDMIAALQGRLADVDLGPEDRGNLHFTLGKIGEDAARYAEAFDHYARGNAIVHARRGYEAHRTTALVEASQTLYTPAFLAERQGWGAQAADPIFIVGLPRSGSTLVDQILASHPDVEGTRELADIQVIADWIGTGAGSGYPNGVASLTGEVCAKLGGDYLAWTAPHRGLARARFTDKAPWNFLHTGLIHLILPNAKIVDVRRHPMGCCLSAFKQHFAQGFDFAYDLSDLGRYYADYVRLMAHFDAVLPGRVHRVIYEDLVADTDSEVRRLLVYLGLPFDPACLRFFENPRPVATPSSEQVRRPIFADAVDQWRNYEPWLTPLKAALGELVADYPPARGEGH